MPPPSPVARRARSAATGALAALAALGAGLVLALLPGPALAQEPAPPPPAGNVQVEAHVVFLDREAARRVGLRYLQVGNGRVQVEGGRRGRRGDGGGVTVGGAGDVAGVPVQAFVEIARRERVLRSESRSQVTVAAGAEGSVSSGTVQLGPWGASRTRGPELVVVPHLLGDGQLRLDVLVRERDVAVGPFGYGVDGSPVSTRTSVVVRSGESATVGTLQATEQRSDVGLLRWGSSEGERDVLVVLKATVMQ